MPPRSSTKTTHLLPVDVLGVEAGHVGNRDGNGSRAEVRADDRDQHRLAQRVRALQNRTQN